MLKGSAFPLEAGLNQLSTGTFQLIRGVRCYEDATLTITPKNGTVYTEDIIAGEDREIINALSVEIVSGLVSFTRNTSA